MPPAEKLPQKKLRLSMIFIAIVAFFCFVGFRLVQLQVIPNAALQSLAQRQFRSVEKKIPFRLPIYDRNEEELAVSLLAGSVFVRPKLIKNRREVARALAKHFGGNPDRWMQKLRTKRPFVWIQRQVPEETAKKLASYKLPGLFVEQESRRIYPNGPLASHVLGFTDVDGNGLAGIERSLNETMLNPGERVQMSRDGKGNPTYIERAAVPSKVASRGIYTTLDRRVQHALEEELEVAMEKSGARAAMAIVMDPHTGEIFGMGQRPAFDPNHAGQAPVNTHANRLLSHLYEPGSTMKVLFAAEAIQSGLMNRFTAIDCEDGKISFGKTVLQEAEADHKFGMLPLEKVIRFSSNIGAVKIAQALGTDRVRATIEKFGLTAKTGISLPGETTAAPKSDQNWLPIFLATVGFGQGVSATPLQIVSSFAPFANGGYLVRPKILLSETVSGEEAEVRRVLSPSTVQMMRSILVSVTEGEGGTGANARVPGIQVAGKTGTAQKYEAGAGYDGKKYFSSFVGFLPADRPELLIGVMVDEPKAPFFYGSQVAAPLFKRLAERSLHILGRNPRQLIVRNPNPKNRQQKEAMLSKVVENQVSEMAPTADGGWIMPDLRGLTMRETLRVVGRYLKNVKLVGEGFLEDQTPKPGTELTAESQVVLKFSADL